MESIIQHASCYVKRKNMRKKIIEIRYEANFIYCFMQENIIDCISAFRPTPCLNIVNMRIREFLSSLLGFVHRKLLNGRPISP